MERRNFFKKLGAATVASTFLSIDSNAESKQLTTENLSENTSVNTSVNKADSPKIIKPKALKKGDTIGLITPGSFISYNGLQKAISNIESLGFKVKLSKNIRKARGYTAGSKEERVNDLHDMFADKDVEGIWAARGGYGCTGLLPLIDFDLIKKNPKVFIGYSDITALHLAINKITGLVTFHGPVASSTFSEYSKKYFEKMIMSANIPPKVYPSKDNDELGENKDAFKPRILNKGKAVGRLIGGNLTLVASMVGTKWGADLNDKLLFIEDVGEAPYRIDRMLIQLNQASNIGSAKGVAIGIFTGANKPEDELSLSVDEMLDDNTKDLTIPASYGFSFGHIRNQFTLPLGIKAEMDAENRTLEFLESAVI